MQILHIDPIAPVSYSTLPVTTKPRMRSDLSVDPINGFTIVNASVPCLGAGWTMGLSLRAEALPLVGLADLESCRLGAGAALHPECHSRPACRRSWPLWPPRPPRRQPGNATPATGRPRTSGPRVREYWRLDPVGPQMGSALEGAAAAGGRCEPVEVVERPGCSYSSDSASSQPCPAALQPPSPFRPCSQ